ncbi:MAG: hypothetical protein AABX37_06305 [Nanoarchaeota archaeon]
MSFDLFPQETVQRIKQGIDDYLQEKKPLPTIAFVIMNTLKEWSYGFYFLMKEGMYAPYFHEQQASNVPGNNCTSVIPSLYIYCDTAKLNPQIVQFRNFRNVRKREDEERGLNDSHFCVLVDVGKKHPYMIDPFQGVFGPILEQVEGYMRIGKTKNYPTTKREFSSLVYYTPREFVELYEHLRTPAGSLDVLVAGQKIYENKTIAHAQCDVKVYYDAQTNTVTTRLYAPQQGIRDKVIFCRQPMDEQGNSLERRVELWRAKDRTWENLIEGAKVAETTFAELYAVRRIMQSMGNPKKHERLGSRIGMSEYASQRRKLEELVGRIREHTGEEAWQEIQKQVLSRALYEATSPEKEYLYSEEERDARLRTAIAKEKELKEKSKSLEERVWNIGWRLEKVSSQERRRVLYQKEKVGKKARKMVEKIDGFNHLRYYHKYAYHRTMDLICFAKTLKDKTVEQLQEMVLEQGAEEWMGYASMLMDYLPFTLGKARKILELRSFWKPLQEKVKARYEQEAS